MLTMVHVQFTIIDTFTYINVCITDPEIKTPSIFSFYERDRYKLS